MFQVQSHTQTAQQDSFIEVIEEHIGGDKFIKCIDLSYNSIDAHGCNVMVKSLKNNHSLLSFDLRGNPGYGEHHQNKIALILVKNLASQCKSNKVY